MELYILKKFNSIKMKKKLIITYAEWEESDKFVTETTSYKDKENMPYHYETTYTPSLGKFVTKRVYGHDQVYCTNKEIDFIERLTKATYHLAHHPVTTLPYTYDKA